MLGEYAMKSRLPVLFAAAVWAICVPVSAHHSFVPVFDAESIIDASGTVTKVDWRNPHVWIYIDVDSESGETGNWGFEMGSINALIRQGWSRKTVQVGDTISVTGYRARDGSKRGNVNSLTLANGTELTGASSNPEGN